MEFLALTIMFLIGGCVIGYKELKHKIDIKKAEAEERRIKNRRIKERYGK